MTIAISLKVNDGIILAADSASTLIATDPAGATAVVNIYNNANKVFCLKKGLPVGAITWGAGSIGTASISTLGKDLRRRFSGSDPEHRDWALDPSSYAIASVAERLKSFMYDELYLPAVKDWKEKPVLGFIVAGYSSGQGMAEEYQINISGQGCEGPSPVRKKEESGITWNGEPEAVSRLLFGFGTQFGKVLRENLGVPDDQVRPALDVIRQALTVPLVMPAMPIQDAIELAEFLVDVTIKFSRFMPGAPTVGGPIEIAAISKHEGFKWVRRKHYFSRELNPELDWS